MAISSFTGNLTNTVAKINEISTANGWGITAAKTSIPSNDTLVISDANGHVLIVMTGIASDSGSDNHGLRLYYNNGSSYRGGTSHYGSGTLTATLYITSHGFIIVNNSYRNEGICAAWVNINDDGTIIYGGTDSNSTVSTTLSGHLIGCKYDETSYQNLAFTPHTNPAGTTLCNATAVGSLGEPQIAKYMYYAPVYQSVITGEVSIGGESYIAYGGMWYLKD
jgi:hypothetical protein